MAGRILFAALILLAGLAAAAPMARAENADGIAVIIGNKNYTGSGIPAVDYAANDAAAMKAFVTGTLGFREGNVAVLNDATGNQLNAMFGTKDDPDGRLKGMVREGRSDVVVYYSGHGAPGLKDKRGYLMPVDGDADVIELTGYALDTLYKNLAALRARSVTVYLDSCFSGESAKGALIKKASPMFRLDDSAVPGGLVVIAAAQGNEIAHWDDESRHGLFTHFLLAAFAGEAAAGPATGARTVTLGGLKTYLDDTMSYEARRRFARSQTASVTGDPATVLAVLAPAPPKPAPAPQAAAPAGPTDRALELAFWDSVKDSKSAADFEAYLEEYPKGVFSPLAHARIKAMNAAASGPPQQPASAAPPRAPTTDEGLADWRKGHDAYRAKDYATAVAWWRKAAALGQRESMAFLGHAYHLGQGVPVDYAEAMRWYRQAADLGEPNAMGNIGFLYHNGLGVPRDFAEAVRWYRKSADAGGSGGMYQMGWCYAFGVGVPKDYGEAMRWFKKAGEAGDPGGWNGLGMLYALGEGVPQDGTEAVRLFHKAIDSGSVDGYANLGYIYDTGRGVPKDHDQAMALWRQGAAQGGELAKAWLAKYGEK